MGLGMRIGEFFAAAGKKFQTRSLLLNMVTNRQNQAKTEIEHLLELINSELKLLPVLTRMENL